MHQIFLVHSIPPFMGGDTITAHKTQEGATLAAVEMTQMLFDMFWDIYSADDSRDHLVKPEITEANWSDVVDKFSEDEDFVQSDGWGSWLVNIITLDVQD